MKKVMVVHAHGRKWDYSLYMVSDKTALKAESLIEEGEWAKAYDLVRENDRTRKAYTKRRDWYSLETIDLLLEYIDRITV